MNREVKPTTKFVRGDVAVMFGCAEALLPKYKGKKWICRTDSFFTDSGVEVVFLEGFIGYFMAQNLTKVSENEELNNPRPQLKAFNNDNTINHSLYLCSGGGYI